MKAWEDEADHWPPFPGDGIGASHGGNGYNDIYTNNHIYEDGLDTTFSGTTARCSRARDEHIDGHVSQDRDTFQSYQSAAFDSTPLPDLSPGTAHNPLDNTDALSISSWEEEDGAGNDMLAGGPSNPNDFRNYRHQDQHDELAERIAHLTRTINAHASTCLEVSSRAVDIARENAHLATQAGCALDAYVLRPALRLVGSSSASAMQKLMRTYSGASNSPGEAENRGVQALRRECEDRLRRALSNCKNGRDMAMIGQTGAAVGMGIRGSFSGREREVNRLKDRLVEQDAVLRDSSRHIRRLMWERDRLRNQLESRHHVRSGTNRPTKVGKASDFEEATVRGSTPTALAKMRARAMTAPPGADPYNPYTGESGYRIEEDEEDARNRERQLTAQLEELRVLMDKMALDEGSKSNNGRRRNSSSSVTSSSSFSSSFFSAPEEEERERKQKKDGHEKEKGERRQQKQLPLPQPLQRQQKQQPAPPPPSSFDMEDPEDPEWTLL
ncbi:hypothetical protein F4775DRAFT_588985 [Biscogniauxia sp. FL1348]|nr:hypothetical protein F4775DRAFT_588985 [Biscogniauxia sp. FL1348]